MPELTRLLEGPPLTEEERAAVEKRFPLDDWKYEVGNGDTVLGYADWLEHRLLGSSDGGEPYFCIDSRGEAVFPGDQVTVLLNKDGSPLSFRGTVRKFNTDDARDIDKRGSGTMDCHLTRLSVKRLRCGFEF
jgi:hypothetical protein